jgi:DNA end-binding protein Ku
VISELQFAAPQAPEGRKLIICAGLSAVGAFAEGPGCIIEHAATELTAISVSQRIATSLSDADFDSVKVESSSVMTIEKFIDTDSIDPVCYDAAYYLAPDGDAGRDVCAVLHEAIAKTGKTALARVVISQRERTIAIRPTGEGLMAHTLYEKRDLNSSTEAFEGLAGIKIDPEMVQLASQLVQRQSGKYDAADFEDRYETRLRAMIDAKLKGEGLDVSEPEEPARTNVVDLMAALKKSLGQATEERKPSPAKKRAAAAKVTP